MGGNGVLLFVGYEWTQSVFTWWYGSEKEGHVQCHIACVCVCVCVWSKNDIDECVYCAKWTCRHGVQACGCGVGKERGTDAECWIDYCTLG